MLRAGCGAAGTLPEPSARQRRHEGIESPAMRSLPGLIPLAAAVASCSSPPSTAGYRDDADFLRAHTPTIEIASGTGAFLVCPELQGRVMTAAVALSGAGTGFVNRDAVAAPDWSGAFANFGGVERFWIGPESGPSAFFFAPGQAHTRENWRVPEGLNRGAFAVTERSATRVVLEREITLANLSGARFPMHVRRALDAPAAAEISAALGGQASGVNLPHVAFRSRTTVTNRGDGAWTQAGGLPCIWILGMFAPGPRAWAIAPFGPTPDPDGGPAVRADYFGQVPPERFKMGTNFALFRADAQQVGKIGVLRNRAADRLGAWDPDSRILTVVKFGPLERDRPYMSEHWGETLPAPYYGDVVNSYNHGGPEPFFELETSSRALALPAGGAHTHESLTIQVRVESDAMLDALLRSALGVDPAEFRRLAD